MAWCLALPVASQAPAQIPATPTKTPVAPTAAQVERVRAGIRLHDQGKFDEAIAIYEEVLKDSPDCLIALYEIANSYQGKKDYAKGLEYAMRGAEYDSPDLASFYMLMASAHDDMGEPAKAIDIYKRGLAIKPTALLHFNLGLTLGRQNNDEEAKSNLKQAVLLNPNHASSHAELGKLFMRRGNKAPGILALTRFLILEPTSARTGEAYQAWLGILQQSAVRGADGNITVPANWSADTSEGDFSPQYLALGIGRTGALLLPPGPTQAQLLVQLLDGWFQSFAGEAPSERTAFAWTYYAPYFIELQKRRYTEPFVYWVSQRTNLEGVREWIADAANRQRGTEFIQWSQRYAWPKP